jgi:hypothetical protein
MLGIISKQNRTTIFTGFFLESVRGTKPDATEVDICGKMADWLTNSRDRDEA